MYNKMIIILKVQNFSLDWKYNPDFNLLVIQCLNLIKVNSYRYYFWLPVCVCVCV